MSGTIYKFLKPVNSSWSWISVGEVISSLYKSRRCYIWQVTAVPFLSEALSANTAMTKLQPCEKYSKLMMATSWETTKGKVT